ncbi:DUF86 domain-containing protein [Spirulina subsalsa FACHB-351]|uniref:DUF86 domain-containing protein n=1 Tax=Spirulina subsalsa FACHB-351 TaxID=234711 RepID=A0ABT3LBJ1_9CYAN|nr:DUF86 domain-containing protein [Spirulina subsalsa]MCW6038879.1 DUF86 domain-containing protein [Spirulina subsalsa FACHB-351]
MSRNLSLYLDDIVTSIEKIQRFTADLNQDAFMADERTFDAVIRNLQVIGEAVKQIPTDLRDRYPQIEWRKVAGLRDILTHAYFSIDHDILWDIIQTQLNKLHDCITKNPGSKAPSF